MEMKRGLKRESKAVYILVCLLFFLVPQSYGQRVVEHRCTNIAHYSDLMREYLESQNRPRFKEVLDSLRDEAMRWDDSLLLIQCHIWETMEQRSQREYQSALRSITIALQLAHEVQDTISLCDAYYMLGMVYQDTENYMSALAAYREALRMESPTQPIPLRRKFAILNNSAIIYTIQDDYSDALSYYDLAIAIQDKTVDDYRQRLLCNMAVLSEFLQDTLQELSYLYKAYPLAKKYNDTIVLLDIHLSLAKIYAHQKRLELVKEQLNTCIQHYADYEPDPYTLAPYRSDLIAIYTALGDYEKANYYVGEVYRCLDGERPSDIYEEFLLRRAKLATQCGDYKEALTFLDSSSQFKRNKDVLLHVLRFDEKELEVVNLYTQNEELLRKLQHENELREQEQNVRMFFLTLAFFFFAFLLLQRYIRVHSHILRKTRQELVRESEYSRQLSQKWSSLEKVLNNQRADLEQSTALLHYILGMLHNNSDKVNRNILFVKNIQQVLLPSMQVIEKAFGESFLLYLPRDTISGDFYWYANAGEYELLALVDCAGHGVPGALMSLIGHVLLNKIVKEWHIHDPANVLTTLHEQIHENLGYQSTTYPGHYSMDLSVIRYHPAKRELVFSSASSSVYVGTSEGITRYRGSIMSAGSTLTNRPYEDVTLSLTPGMWVYLTSDGFIDQLNEEYRKFGNQKFQDTLHNLSEYPADEQLYFLTEQLYLHKGTADQADDICVIGIHF